MLRSSSIEFEAENGKVYVKSMESLRSHSWSCDSEISPQYAEWPGESLEEVDQRVKWMLRLIEEGGGSSEYQERRAALIAQVEEFYHMYQTLAKHHNLLSKELQKIILPGLQIQGSSISEPDSTPVSHFLTPNQKLGAHNSSHQVGLDVHFSSGGDSSDFSLKEGSKSSSSLSSDSQSESFNSAEKIFNLSAVGDGEGFPKIIDIKTEVPSMRGKLALAEEDSASSVLKAGEDGNIEELVGRITAYEDELRVVNLKLQLSEEEVADLKCQLKNNEYLTGTLQARLESAFGGIKRQKADLELEKRQASQLREQIIKLENQISNSDDKIRALEDELEVCRNKLNGSAEELGKLKHELTKTFCEGSHQLQGELELAREDIVKLEMERDSERRRVIELQKKIAAYMADATAREHEVRELNVALVDAQNNYFLEKAQFQAEICSFSEQKTLLEVRLKECEVRSKSLEDEIEQCEAEKMKMRSLHESGEIILQGEIEILKAEHAERGGLVEDLHKKLDTLKLKYEMLMAEKDEVNGKRERLMAEISCEQSVIRELEERLSQSHRKHMELIAGADSAEKLVDELKVRVEELEKEVGKQRVLMAEGAEEKREAIRQLCYSLDYYRSGYHELRQAFIGHKRLAVVAS